jgi:hypothetical protein
MPPIAGPISPPSAPASSAPTKPAPITVTTPAPAPSTAPDTSADTSPPTAPGSPSAPDQDAAPPPRSRTSGTRETLAHPPEKENPVISPVFKGAIPPASHRLEDRVQEEVRQLFEQEAASNPTKGNSLGSLSKPRQRLGW